MHICIAHRAANAHALAVVVPPCCPHVQRGQRRFVGFPITREHFGPLSLVLLPFRSKNDRQIENRH
jgi:hypothetical protein